MDANQKFQKIIRSLIRRAAEAEIVSEIPLEPEQLAALAKPEPLLRQSGFERYRSRI